MSTSQDLKTFRPVWMSRPLDPSRPLGLCWISRPLGSLDCFYTSRPLDLSTLFGVCCGDSCMLFVGEKHGIQFTRFP